MYAGKLGKEEFKLILLNYTSQLGSGRLPPAAVDILSLEEKLNLALQWFLIKFSGSVIERETSIRKIQ